MVTMGGGQTCSTALISKLREVNFSDWIPSRSKAFVMTSKVFFIVAKISAIATISFEIMSSADILGLKIVCVWSVEDCIVGSVSVGSVEGEEGEVGGVAKGEKRDCESRALIAD